MGEVLKLGSCIGQYRLMREIGRGGMGIVYEAVHVEIGRRAAVKVLSPRRADVPRNLQRFLNEARTISRVRHPGLVQIYDYGQTPTGAPYLLMELLEGATLRQRLARGKGEGTRPSIAEVRRVVRQIAAPLAATHDEGIVHHDLKPENVMLVADEEAPDGERVKLLDFGIARFVGSQEAAPSAPGTTLGTAAYMSPEQSAGEPDIGTATDVYALGVILYELLTGAPPFDGPSTEVMRKHIHVEPPPLDPKVPDDLANLVTRMLAKAPTLRPSIRDVVKALVDSQGSAAIPDDPPSPGPSRIKESGTETIDVKPPVTNRRARWPHASWVAAAVLILGLGVWLAIHLLISRSSDSSSPATRIMAFGAKSGVKTPTTPTPAALADMIWIPGGTFTMGRTTEELAAECKRLAAECVHELLDREQPPRRVTLSPFFLDRLEVTNDQFARWLTTISPKLEVREDDESHAPRWVYLRGALLLDLDERSRAGVERVADGTFRARGGDKHEPVSHITWDGALLYCKSRGKRLPTEAEWEFAARGHTARRFPWGDREPACDDVAWGRAEGKPCASRSLEPGPIDVGTAPLDRTPEGVRDMGGNVMEWVQDQFIRPYLPDCGTCVNPVGEEPLALESDMRVLRGGSWVQHWSMSRSTMRARWRRVDAMMNAGFRCASQ